jgi:hypothetical protein
MSIYFIGLSVPYYTIVLELEAFILFLKGVSVARYGQVSWFHGTSLRLRGHPVAFFDSYSARLYGHEPVAILSPILPHSDLTTKPDEVREVVGALVDTRRAAYAAEHGNAEPPDNEVDENVGRYAAIETVRALGVYAKV